MARQPAFNVKQRPDGRWEASCRRLPNAMSIEATADEAIAAHKVVLADFDDFSRWARLHYVTKTCGGNCRFCVKEREAAKSTGEQDG